MEVGFIGAGNMGTILVESFLEAGALSPSQIGIHNRTPEKARRLAAKFPGIQVAGSIPELARSCDALFICVRPADYREVLASLKAHGRPEQFFVSITSSVLLQDLERWLLGKVIKIIPSITNAVQSGAVLVTFGSRLTQQEQKEWLRLLAAIGHPVETDEEFVRISSDITSCGPAFFSYLLGDFIEKAHRHSGISKEHAAFLATKMITGFAQLLEKERFTLQTLLEKVCVPGGVTGAGLQVLREELNSVFLHVFAKTHEKFEEDLQESKARLS